jgi:tetratricopeptide (TPR) repeat protein
LVHQWFILAFESTQKMKIFDRKCNHISSKMRAAPLYMFQYARYLSHILLIILQIYFLVKPTKLIGQLSTDAPTQQLVVQALSLIYNQEFGETEPIFKQIKAKYPNHPVNPLLKAIQWQWQYLPIKDNKAMARPYQQQLELCLAQAKNLEKDEKTKVEAAFFVMASHGYMGLMHNHNDDWIKAATEAKRAYNYLIDGIAYTERNPEFLFSTGMYNYYIVQYPKEHGIIKPITIFFRDGNKDLGLKQIEQATRKGTFTRAEALFFGARIYLKHEAKFDKALPYTQQLITKYPNNPIYLMKHTEGLILSGKYAEARPYLDKLNKKTDKFFPMACQVFEGLMLEKQNKNDAEASQKYQNALRMPYDDEFTKEYHVFATAGLARIAARAKDNKKAHLLYKKVLQTAEYEHLRTEAEAYLK